MKLSYQQRKHMNKKQFIFPGKAPGGGSYPIPDLAHARNALARVSANGSPSEKAHVQAAVYRKFPGLKKRHQARAGK